MKKSGNHGLTAAVPQQQADATSTQSSEPNLEEQDNLRAAEDIEQQSKTSTGQPAAELGLPSLAAKHLNTSAEQPDRDGEHNGAVGLLVETTPPHQVQCGGSSQHT